MNLSALTASLWPLRPNRAKRPVTWADIKRQYRRPPSFTDLLPWMEYLPDSQTFLLEDGESVGALFELTPVGVEARTAEYLEQLRNGLQTALTDALPEEDESPWILQAYVQDEPHMDAYLRRIEDYVQANVQDTAFTRHYLRLYRDHLNRITRPGGLFIDTAVTGERWQGKFRRTRLVLYRRGGSRHEGSAEDTLNDAAARLEAAFASTEIRLRRATGRDFYEWMLPWFNPNPEAAGGERAKLLRIAPYPGDKDLPYGADFAEGLTLSMPRSDNATGSWWFDRLAHTVISVQRLRRKPRHGHFTASRRHGDHIYALFDKLPAYTTLAMTIVVKRQDHVRRHVSRIHRAAVGDMPEAMLAREEADEVMREMARGDKLFPVALALYVRGRDLRELHHNTNAVHAVLAPNGLQLIGADSDLLQLDSYIRNLPMAYDAEL
ncbi:MAG: TraC family protein, partial [bacterium]|nr:TraC family protein [bacterium]